MAQVRSLFGGQNTTVDDLRLKTPSSVAAIQNTAISPTPTRVSGSLFSDLGAGALGGAISGQAVGVGTDLPSSLLSIGTATATGAASGALVGGPVGALVGGGVGFLSSALNSYLSVKAENKRKREMDRYIKEVEAKNAKRENLNRKDSLMKLRFQRSDIERDKAIQSLSTKRQFLIDAINSNQNLKNQFIKTGIR